MRNPVTLLSAGPVDLADLTAPLDGPRQTGSDLHFDPRYKAISEARREENARLPQGVWARDIKRADWPEVERLCSEILRTRSKDLQVASWLAEAWLHRTGFAGLAPGLRLLSGLCRRFWPNLYPAIDDGDLAPRLAPFEWLNVRFPALLRDLPVVRSGTNPDETYTLTDYMNARLLEGLRQRDAKSVERSEAAGAVSLAAFNAVRDRTDTRFWEDNQGALQDAVAALDELNTALEEACLDDAPGLGAIADASQEILSLTSVALAERRPKPLAMLRRVITGAPSAQAQAQVPERVAEPASTAQPHQADWSREDAYAQLAEIADLLERQEPHSPVPYLIRCAVAWGSMSFAELVMSFSNAGLDLGKVFEVLGLANISGSPENFDSVDKEF
jgi:type VI secretion system protein ImpA